MTLNQATRFASDRSLILVIDDEPSICWAFERLLKGDGHEVVVASSAEEGMRIATQRTPDLIFLDVRLPKENGISVLPKLINATQSPVIIMTAFGDLETAVSAVKKGASDYLIKPFCLDTVQKVCNSTLQRHRKCAPAFEPIRIPHGEDKLVGHSAAIQKVFRQIALVASSDVSVLVTGETGTGKELVAAAIHRHSHRTASPYLPVAPAAFNPDLIESELFGHAAGAFTGATTDRAGLFEKAEGGTVLLDEIGELPLSIQVKLLRVLEQGLYTRVGEVESRRCNVRVIAATNRCLDQAIVEGQFREDLFYRLNGLHIHLPPLRERIDDIKPLIAHFLSRINYANPDGAISDSLLIQLQERPWPGNVRELRNAVQHAAVIARGRPLALADFPESRTVRSELSLADSFSVAKELQGWLLRQKESGDGTKMYDRAVAVIEPTILQFALDHCDGNRAKAAEFLGIHRGTLREKLRKHGLDESNAP